MISNVNEKVDAMLEKEVEKLGELRAEEKAKVLDGLSKVYKERISYENARLEYKATMIKAESDSDAVFKKANTDKEIACITSDDAKKELVARTIMQAIELGSGLAFNYYWMHKGFTFETTGGYSSTTFRTLWQGFMHKH